MKRGGREEGNGWMNERAEVRIKGETWGITTTDIDER
jgi:hypothetical protein